MWRSSARGAGPSAFRRSRSRRSSSSGLTVGGYAVEPSLLPDVPFAIYGMADIGRSEMLRQEAIPPTTINAIPATRKSGRSRLPALAWRSVPGEVGGRSSIHTLSHTIPA
jgi:hypothetical protein